MSRHVRLLLVFTGALALSACATSSPVARTHVVPAGSERAYDTYHYSPAVRVGDTVIVSGIPSGNTGDYATDVRRMFTRIRETLAAAGASMADVVELESFHAHARDTAAFSEEMKTMFAVHAEFFGAHYPAWTAVGTTALLAPGAAVEMRVVAVVGSRRNARVDRAASSRD